MAENKKSFLLYCDIWHTIKKLPDDKAGLLFKHVLSYVNDENPIVNDLIVELVFEPIKQSLKRDLDRWESICNRNKLNGAKGGRPKIEEPKKPTGLFGNPKEPKKPDSDSDSDSDIESEKNSLSKLEILTERKKDFYASLVPFIATFGKDLIRDFYNYWSEANKSQTKMRWESEKTWETNLRLGTWKRRGEKQNSKPIPQNEIDRPPKPTPYHTDWNEEKKQWMYSPIR